MLLRSELQLVLAAPRPAPGDGLRSTAAAGPDASVLPACSRNRTLRHRRSSKGVASNVASRDEKRALRLPARTGRAVGASNFSGFARIQLFDQSVDESGLRPVDLPSCFLGRKEARSIDFRKSFHLPRTRRPLHLERVRHDLEAFLQVTGKRPRMNYFSAFLLQAAQVQQCPTPRASSSSNSILARARRSSPSATSPLEWSTPRHLCSESRDRQDAPAILPVPPALCGT